MLKKAKTIKVPFIFSYFFIKMLFFDVDLFSPCFDMESPICYNKLPCTKYTTMHYPKLQYTSLHYLALP